MPSTNGSTIQLNTNSLPSSTDTDNAKSIEQKFQRSFMKNSLQNSIKPLNLSGSVSGSPTSSMTNLPKINGNETESERIKHCGSLFDRRSTINQELLQEFFRREPCPYGTRLLIFSSLHFYFSQLVFYDFTIFMRIYSLRNLYSYIFLRSKHL